MIGEGLIFLRRSITLILPFAITIFFGWQAYAQSVDGSGGVRLPDGSMSFPAIDANGHIDVRVVNPIDRSMLPDDAPGPGENVPTPTRRPRCLSGNEPDCPGNGRNNGGESSGPTGPTAQCQSALQNTQSCSRAPQMQSGQGRGNILGNYDLISGRARQDSGTLNQFASRCRSLMSSCAQACSGTNPYNAQLKNQCYQYQSVVSASSNEAQNLQGISSQTEQAAQRIRSGESAAKAAHDHGRGRGLSREMPKPISAKETGVSPLTEDKKKVAAVAPTKIERDSEEEDEEVNSAATKRRADVGVHLEEGQASTVSASSDKKDPKLSAQPESMFEKISKKIFAGFIPSKKKRPGRLGSLEDGGGQIKGRSLSRDKKLMNAAQILEQKRLDMLRGIASSSLGVGDPKTFIFYNVCVEYDSYEERHNIHQGRTQCPPKTIEEESP